jgi:hypothetical protein
MIVVVVLVVVVPIVISGDFYESLAISRYTKNGLGQPSRQCARSGEKSVPRTSLLLLSFFLIILARPPPSFFSSQCIIINNDGFVVGRCRRQEMV